MSSHIQDKHLQSVLSRLPVAVCSCDLGGRLLSCNEQALQLWGWAPPLDGSCNVLAGARLILPGGAEQPWDQTPLAAAIHNGQPLRHFLGELERKDGSRFTASFGANPVHDDQGELTGAVIVFDEVSSLKNHTLEAPDDASHHAAFLTQLTQKLALINDPAAIARAACEDLGRHLRAARCFFAESISGQDLVQIADDWSREGLSSLAGAYRSGEFASPELLAAPAPLTLLIADVATHPYTRAFAAKFEPLGIRSFALAPFARADGRISNLMVTDTGPREWPAAAVALLESVVARVRPLVEQARAVQEVRDNVERLRLALAASQMGDWNWDAASGLIKLSAAAASVFNLTEEQKVCPKLPLSLVHEEDRDRVRRVVDEAIRTRTDFDVECRLSSPGGSVRWVIARGRPIYGGQEQLTGILGVVQDVTSRKFDEDARRQFAAIVESSDDAIISKDINGIVTSWNRGAERIFGYSEEEMVGRSITTLIPPDRAQEEADIMARVRRGERTDHFETVRLHKGGGRVHVSVTISPLRDRNGIVVGASKIARDITAQKRTEDELRASEARWRQLAEAMPHLVLICAPEGSGEFISPQWCAYTGRSEREQRGFGWAEAIHPEDRKGLEAAWNRAAHARGILDVEVRIRRSDGVYRWFKTRAVPVTDGAGNILKWNCSNTDIEDIKRTDLALRENESRLSALFAQAGSGIIQTDLDGRIVMVNDAYCEIVDRKREELLGMRIHDLTHPSDRHLHQGPFEDMMSGGPAFIIEKRDLRLDGTAVWVRNSVVGIRDSEGRVTAGLTITQDITDSREAEDAMRASEEQLRLVTDHAPVLLAQFDRMHRYKFVNQPYAERYGCEPLEVIGKHASEILGAAGYQAVLRQMELAFRGRRVEFEMELSQDAGATRWGHVIFVPERTADGEVVGIVTVLTDITKRKEEERELEQARDRALAAVRAKDEFLARLSHELRTPLSPVLLLASEGAANPHLPEAARADFEIIRKNVDLEARLIDDLLDLTRITRGKLALDFNPVDVHSILQDAVATMRSEAAHKNIELELKLDAPQHGVSADAVRLQQVFWNLLNNSVKFTSPGGRICVQTRLVTDQGPVLIEVTDNGIGMTAEELQRVFDAFSQGDHAGMSGSTQFGGLGLGLAISRMLVELHRGQIRAASEGRGKGATFAIELPLLPLGDVAIRLGSGDSQPTVPLTPPKPSAPPVAALRILLVEDHEPTRAALSSLLGRRGHVVMTAGTLADARSLVEHEPFDLVISDIGLPDGTGYDFMSELREKRPVKGIALSGYGMEQDIARSRDAGFACHLTKPVRMQSLDSAIADAMGS